MKIVNPDEFGPNVNRAERRERAADAGGGVAVLEEPAKTFVGRQRGNNSSRSYFRSEIGEDGLHFMLSRGVRSMDHEPFTAPRHHHAFQQVRWCDSGRKNFAPGQYIEPGDVAYFPKGAYYGPEYKRGHSGFATQFGFGDEYQVGPEWQPYVRQARANLISKGTTEGGMYTWVDPDSGETRQTETIEAAYAEACRLRGWPPYRIPDAGYEAPILIHPRNFDYYELSAGVELKPLGSFFSQPGPDGDLRLAMCRLSEVGTYELNKDRAVIVITTTAGLHVDGHGETTYPVHTAAYSPLGEHAAISGEPGTEAYILEYPRRG
jgi:hypothetical protein